MKKTKAGYKTTEFWLTLISSVGTLVTTIFGVPIPMETIMGVSGTIITYILGRTMAKRS